jgi:aldehyde dehydrogenase (NAD(P)+)
MDETLARLRAGAERFAKLSLDERIALARSMQRGYLRIASRSVEAARAAKGLPPDAVAEDWACGPWIAVRALRLVIESLEALQRTGNTPVGPVTQTANGRLAVRVFPANAIDGLLFKDVTVDVHMAEGVTEEQMHASRARFYKGAIHGGKVVAVLGAGNIDSIPTWDVVSKMFNEGKVCVLKMNPVNAYLGPLLEEAFADAIEQGFFAVAYGGADEGAYLVQHKEVDEVHLTGSDKTYDMIVWGPPGPERDRHQAERRPVLAKPLSAELGNVSPIIVVPGPYTDKELVYQAEETAAAFAMNAAFCCCTPRVLVTAANWPRRDAFLNMIADVLRRMPPRAAYYPGAAEKFRTATKGRKTIRKIGSEHGDALAWALVPDLDSWNPSDPAFLTEQFCPVLFETALEGTDTDEFLYKAVDFANNRLWGTLNATLVVHPRTQRDPVLGQAVENAIDWLRYGTVAVNAYPAMSFAFGTPPWGAHPGSNPADIQSGSGWVHNARMLERIEKTVLRHPLTAFPKPAYFPSHRTAARMLPRLTALEEHASWWRVPRVVAAAIRC